MKLTDYLIKTPSQTLAVEVKRNIRSAHLGAIIQHIKKLQPIRVLVADYLNPNLLHISCQKPALETKQETNKTFDLSGLKVIYDFLCNRPLVNASYREIGEQTGIALGAIGKVLKSFVDAGFLIDPGKSGKRQLINLHKLLDRWVEAYLSSKPMFKVGKDQEIGQPSNSN